MHGYVCTARCFADICDCHEYGQDMGSNFLVWIDSDMDTLPPICITR